MNFSKEFKKGFTLIELLVVVAIIGILASIVMSNLNGARVQGSDVSVKANMANMRSQAENWYADNGNKYSTSAVTGTANCTATLGTSIFTDSNFTQAIAEIANQSDPTSTIECNTSANGQKWGLSSSVLKGGGGWCVDNSGWAKDGVAAAGICS